MVFTGRVQMQGGTGQGVVVTADSEVQSPASGAVFAQRAVIHGVLRVQVCEGALRGGPCRVRSRRQPRL